MWRISRILNKSPFDDYVLDLTAPEMDFMLEMYSKDHPDEYKFSRTPKNEPDPMIFKLWADKFVGKTLNEFSLSPVAYFNKYYNKSKRDK